MRRLLPYLRRFAILSPLFLAAGMLLAVQQYAPAYCFNFDRSFPRGLYRLTDRPAARGRMVLVCRETPFPRVVSPRHSLGRLHCPSLTEPLLKLVVATDQDLVTLANEGIKVNGVRLPNSAPRTVDRAGRRLPRFRRGAHVLPAGYLWLYAPVANSWDSRYFGPVPRDQVKAVVRPVWVWSR